MKKHYITPETFIIEGKTEKHLLAGSYDVDLSVGQDPMDGGDARSKQQFGVLIDDEE